MQMVEMKGTMVMEALIVTAEVAPKHLIFVFHNVPSINLLNQKLCFICLNS